MTTPRELAGLLLDLGRAGVELALHPTDSARLRHRPATLAPDVSAGLRLHRAVILDLLAGDGGPADPEAAYILAERLGAADGLELPTHPGSPAWAIALGRALGAGDSAPVEAMPTPPEARDPPDLEVVEADAAPDWPPPIVPRSDATWITGERLVEFIDWARRWNEQARERAVRGGLCLHKPKA